MNIAFFGSSLVSSYWNGAASYYRGLIRALDGRGHRVTFYEPDAYDRQTHRDMEDPDWARVVVYESEGAAGVMRSLEEARSADLVIKASGAGVKRWVLREGRVAETGKHRELMRQGGYYAGLVQRQTRGLLQNAGESV